MPRQRQPRTNRFQFHRQYCMLTYSQANNLDVDALSAHLTSLGAKCVIGRENHADGGTHYHVYCMWDKEFYTREVTKFDVGGYHPNISPTRYKPREGFKYATKDGDIVFSSIIYEDLPERINNAKRSKGNDDWAEIIDAPTREEYFENLRALQPRALCTAYNNIKKYADDTYFTPPPIYETPPNTTFYPTPALREWVQQWIKPRSKSI